MLALRFRRRFRRTARIPPSHVATRVPQRRAGDLPDTLVWNAFRDSGRAPPVRPRHIIDRARRMASLGRRNPFTIASQDAWRSLAGATRSSSTYVVGSGGARKIPILIAIELPSR